MCYGHIRQTLELIQRFDFLTFYIQAVNFKIELGVRVILIRTLIVAADVEAIRRCLQDVKVLYLDILHLSRLGPEHLLVVLIVTYAVS